MPTAKLLPATKRSEFRSIITQLDRTMSEKKILRIVAEAHAFLNEYDMGWDAVAISLPHHYVPHSERVARKKTRPVKDAAAASKAAQALNGLAHLGRDGRAMLKLAVSKHPDWPTVRDTLEIDLAHINVNDLIAVAQMLKIDGRFIMLVLEGEKTSPQADLPFEEAGK